MLHVLTTVSDVVSTAKRAFGAAAPAGDMEAGRVSTVGKMVATPLADAPVRDAAAAQGGWFLKRAQNSCAV